MGDAIAGPEEEQRKVRRLSRRAGLLISFVSAVVYTVLGLGTIYFILLAAMGQDTSWVGGPDEIVWKITSVFYFSSWIVGVKFDKDNEEDSYVSAPNYGRLRMTDVAAVLVVAIIFGMIAVMESIKGGGAGLVVNVLKAMGYRETALYQAYQGYGPKVFLILLNLLWIANIVAWLVFIRRIIRPMSDRSRLMLEKRGKFFEIAKIEVLDHYLQGDWQSVRFGIGAAYLIAVDLLIIYMERTGGSIREYEYLLIAAFVLGVEAWVWHQRFKVRSALRLLEDMSVSYELIPKGKVDEAT